MLTTSYADPIDAIESSPIEGEEVPWQLSYNPLPNIVETANATAHRHFGAAHVRITTSDGATWSCTAVDAEGRAIDASPVSIDITPEDAVVAWMERVDEMPLDVDHGARPLTLAEAFPAGMTFSLEDCDAPFVDLATGREVVIVDAADRAEVA